MASMIFSMRVVNTDGVKSYAVDAQHRLYVSFEGIESWPAAIGALRDSLPTVTMDRSRFGGHGVGLLVR